jgi:hypothetical protein
MESAVADVLLDWTLLPEDFLVTVMCELDVPSLIRAGAVCAPWHCAYATFRRLRLPSPRQPPCLLYSCDTAAAALYCPSTAVNVRIPIRGMSPIGSAHGWLVVADEVSNLHLTNPLTGGRVALPPITTLRGFQEGTCFDEHGNLAYNYQEQGEATFIDAIPVGEAADCTYERAVLSCDERWTWIPPGDGVTGLQRRNFYCNATYNDNDGLVYVVHFLDSIYSLDLNGPSPVVTRIIPELRYSALHSHYRYLIHAPWGDLLLASRFRDESDPSVEICTEELQLYRVFIMLFSLVTMGHCASQSI